jgi:hypothetical protein
VASTLPTASEARRLLILASTRFDQSPWMQTSVVRVVPAGAGRRVNLRVARLAAGIRIDFGEAYPQPALAGEQHRQVRRIDLRQIRQHVEEAAQPSCDRRIHALPDDRLRLWIRLDVASLVEDLNQPNLRGIELIGDPQRLIVPLLFDLVMLERRPDENRNDQLALPAHHLGQRKHGAGAGPLAAAGDENHD